MGMSTRGGRDEGLIVSAGTPTATTTPELDYSFRRKFGVEIRSL
ncbi:MAG: hypothetical protein ACLUVG_07670 [Phocaeicola vulgatus]